MSRSGYTEDYFETWDLVRWRGAVASAIRGRRGQAFLREMAAALDAMPQRRLIVGRLVRPDGECCAIGAVLRARGRTSAEIHRALYGPPLPGLDAGDDPEDDADRADIAALAGISGALAAEIMEENDDYQNRTPEERWLYMRQWVASRIKEQS